MPRTLVLICGHCTRAFCVPSGWLPPKCLSKKCEQPAKWRVATLGEIEKSDRDFLKRVKILPEF